MIRFSLCSLLATLPLITASGAGQIAYRRFEDSTLPNLGQARALGRVVENVQVTVSLQPRDLVGLEAYASAVSDPRSPLYRHFLTPAEIGQRFGASQENRRIVADYFRRQGLTVSLDAPNGMAVILEGAANRIENAFGTRLTTFAGKDAATQEAITFRANTGPVVLPSTVGQVVTNVSGLETYSRPMPRLTTLTPMLASGLYKIAPAQAAGFNGEGRNIAISNFDGFRLSNARLFTRSYGLPVPAAGSGSNIAVVPVGTPAGPGKAKGEGDVDIEMVLAMAPLANIRIYDSKNDIVGVLTREASDNWADVVTESYGWNLSNAAAQACHNQHLAMTAQGMTYAAASGDKGTDMTPYSYPNCEPEVLQVGGTQADANSPSGSRKSEVGWKGSGGGWVSNTLGFNVLPAWQKGKGVPTNINRRLVPDVAFHAYGSSRTPGAYYVYFNGTLNRFAGTSCAAPLFAASLAVVEQRLASAGRTVRQGRIQDFLYTLNGQSPIFFDVVSGANGKLPKTANTNSLTGPTSSAHPGWDFVTGWGAIDFDALYEALS